MRGIVDDPHRFKVIVIGRRGKKTGTLAIQAVAKALQGQRRWIVVPSYAFPTPVWRNVQQLAEQIPGHSIERVHRIAHFPGGGWIAMRSADDPSTLRGEGLDGCDIDEAAYIPSDEGWEQGILPALSDRIGEGAIWTTPKGRNWVYRRHLLSKADPDWASWQIPTWDANPEFPKSERERIERAHREGRIPDSVFRQEYLAEFVEDAGLVFRRVMENATATLQDKAVDGHQYAIGVDWAKTHDFNVFTVLDMTTNEIVHIDHSNQVDFRVQRGRLEGLCERFKPTVVVCEINSIGEPNFEELWRAGLPVRRFSTTNDTKAEIVEAVQLAFETGRLKIPADPGLIDELQSFESTKLPSGKIRYAAPEGIHDDRVISLCLAWSATSTGDIRVWEV